MLDETSTLLSSFDRLQSSAAAIARGADHRAELASIELSEARDSAVGISVLFLGGAVAALLTGVAINFFVAGLWWDTPHRLLALGLLAGIQALAAIIALVIGFNRARRWYPLPQTIEQFKKDSQCLRELLTKPNR